MSSSIPSPEFWILEAETVPRAAAPTLSVPMRVSDSSGLEVFGIALRIQILIAAAKRPHDSETRERLIEVFGEAERWGDTARGMLWQHADVMIPSFTGATRFDVTLPVTADLEVASYKYFSALPDGEIPLSFQFNGTVYYRGEDDRAQLTQVPWSSEADFQLPVATWRRAVDEHYPNGGFMRLGDDVLWALRRYRSERGLVTLEECIRQLIADAPVEMAE